MSRPVKYGGDRVSTSVRLDADVHKRLIDAAAERDVSTNWLINRALGEFLDRLLPVDQIVFTRSPTTPPVEGDTP